MKLFWDGRVCVYVWKYNIACNDVDRYGDQYGVDLGNDPSSSFPIIRRIPKNLKLPKTLNLEFNQNISFD